MNYVNKLTHYYPGKSWYASGEDYSGIVWQDDSPKPTKAVLDKLAWPPEPTSNPADYPLLPWQFKAMVDYLGKDDEIRSAIGTIQQPLQRAASLSRYLHASSYEFGDPLLQQMRQAVGMSEEALAVAWMLAKDLKST